MEIELATTEELVLELMSRKTFVGLILKSQDEQRSPEQVHEKFDLYTMGGEQATVQMLEHALLLLKG